MASEVRRSTPYRYLNGKSPVIFFIGCANWIWGGRLVVDLDLGPQMAQFCLRAAAYYFKNSGQPALQTLILIT